nr:DMT family transporter [Paucimonas lemoignei]
MVKRTFHPITWAIIWMTGALASFIAMALAGRALSSSLGTFQILFFRSLCGLIVISILLGRSGWRQIFTGKLRWHVLRNVSHFGGQFGWFYGLAFIPLAEVFAIEFTAPIWTALVAAILLKERLTPTRIGVIVSGLIGVLIIVKPGTGLMQPAAFAVLLGAIAYAVSYVMTKKLSSTESPLCILFYMTVIQLPLGLIPSLGNFTIPPLFTWPLIFIVGVTALSAHFCITKAMSFADATIVVPMDFLRLPIIALIGAALYGESVHSTVFVGAALIMGANLFGLLYERRNQGLAKAK